MPMTGNMVRGGDTDVGGHTRGYDEGMDHLAREVHQLIVLDGTSTGDNHSWSSVVGLDVPVR